MFLIVFFFEIRARIAFQENRLAPVCTSHAVVSNNAVAGTHVLVRARSTDRIEIGSAEWRAEIKGGMAQPLNLLYISHPLMPILFNRSGFAF